MEFVIVALLVAAVGVGLLRQADIEIPDLELPEAFEIED